MGVEILKTFQGCVAAGDTEDFIEWSANSSCEHSVVGQEFVFCNSKKFQIGTH